jgi:hypothetical protein
VRTERDQAIVAQLPLVRQAAAAGFLGVAQPGKNLLVGPAHWKRPLTGVLANRGDCQPIVEVELDRATEHSLARPPTSNSSKFATVTTIISGVCREPYSSPQRLIA